MSLRSIKKTFNRFLSILGIVALGAGFLAGLIATTPDMRDTTDKYLDTYNLYDIDIKGGLGLTNDDVSALKQLGYFEKVMPAYVTDLIMLADGETQIVTRVYGVLEKNAQPEINDVKLLSGRMPERAGECVIQIPDGYSSSASTYKELSVSENTPDYSSIGDMLKITDFKIVGIVESPIYISLESEASSVGNGKVAIALFTFKDAFSLEVYTDIFATVSGAEKLNCFTDEYRDLLASTDDKLTPVGEERSQIRYDAVIKDAQDELDRKKKELQDKKNDVYGELADALKLIKDGSEQLDTAKTAYSTLADQLKQAESEKAALENNLLILRNNVADYTVKQANLKQAADSFQHILDSGGTLTDDQYKLLSSYKAITDFLAAAPANEAALLEGISQYKSNISSGWAQYSSLGDTITENEQKIADAQKEYNDGKAKADSEFSDADRKIADAQKEIDDIGMPEWYILDRNDNSGYNSYNSNAMKVEAIAKMFPVFFFLVAALVALTTMTRMVDEERGQIGTLKSLGFTNSKILKYYISYSAFAATLGTVSGLLIGFKIFPTVISNAYKMMFNVPIAEAPFRWEIALPVAAVTIFSILLATFFACKATMYEKPATLMTPRAPAAGKRILLERIKLIWNHLSFMHKVTARNIFRYKKRFLMTIIGVAGCSALLVAGFGIRGSVNTIVDKQFGEVFKYDFMLRIDETEDITAEGEMLEFLNGENVKSFIPVHTQLVTIIDGTNTEATIEVPDPRFNVGDFFEFRDRKSGKEVEFNNNSVLITEKAAEQFGVKAGDSIKIRDTDNRTYTVTITGVTENYITTFIYMGAEAYSEIFGDAIEYNTVVGIKEADTGLTNEQIAESALSRSGINYCIFNQSIEDSFAKSVSSIDYIIGVLILCAGMLTVIVIYNLTNVNICERKKELATLKVLGFYDRETSQYIFRETNILSLIGTLFGLAGGIWLHAFIVKTIEVDSVMFGRSISWDSFLISAAISIGFTLFVDLIMKRNIDTIDMVEAMKAND